MVTSAPPPPTDHDDDLFPFLHDCDPPLDSPEPPPAPSHADIRLFDDTVILGESHNEVNAGISSTTILSPGVDVLNDICAHDVPRSPQGETNLISYPPHYSIDSDVALINSMLASLLDRDVGSVSDIRDLSHPEPR